MASDEKVVETICGFCHSECGIRVYVKNGVIDKIKGNPKHPAGGGRICQKGVAAKEFVHSPHRLRHPLMRTNDGFKVASWDEALNFIATKLSEIRERYGPESLVLYRGDPATKACRDGLQQLAAAYGTPNHTSPGHLCSIPRRIALDLTYGTRTNPDYERSKCIVMWGANPTDSMTMGERIKEGRAAYGKLDRVIPGAKKGGAKLIVIDPMYTRTAALADEFVQINLGTDLAFGLAMANVIIDEELYDKDFTDNWTVGFEEFKKHVKQYTPAWAEKVTGISADKIKQIARIYATTKPAAIRDGNGLEQRHNVVQTVRLIGILTAITGNLDVPGGNVFFPSPKLAHWPTVVPQVKHLGADKYPLFPTAPLPSVIDAILTGKPYEPRAMIVYHGNPVLVSANENRVREALKKLELLVVYDVFKTATAELAHVILPDTTDFERVGFEAYSSPQGGFLTLREKVVEPIGQARPVFEVEYDLARRMGLHKLYPWKTTEEWINYRLGPTRVTVEGLRRQPVIFVTPPLQYKKYLRKGFNTPSGKVEVYSNKLAELGYDPMPVYEEAIGKTLAPDVSPEYPLLGTTRRPGIYVHTRFRNLPTLHAMYPDPLIRICPDDAEPMSINDGDKVTVSTAQGSIRVQAKITTETRPGVVVIDYGWGNPWDNGANVNVLTSDEGRDPICAATPNREFHCQVARA